MKNLILLLSFVVLTLNVKSEIVCVKDTSVLGYKLSNDTLYVGVSDRGNNLSLNYGNTILNINLYYYEIDSSIWGGSVKGIQEFFTDSNPKNKYLIFMLINQSTELFVLSANTHEGIWHLIRDFAIYEFVPHHVSVYNNDADTVMLDYKLYDYDKDYLDGQGMYEFLGMYRETYMKNYTRLYDPELIHDYNHTTIIQNLYDHKGNMIKK